VQYLHFFPVKLKNDNIQTRTPGNAGFDCVRACLTTADARWEHWTHRGHEQ
jgi:hypothetical protein